MDSSGLHPTKRNFYFIWNSVDSNCVYQKSNLRWASQKGSEVRKIFRWHIFGTENFDQLPRFAQKWTSCSFDLEIFLENLLWVFTDSDEVLSGSFGYSWVTTGCLRVPQGCLRKSALVISGFCLLMICGWGSRLWYETPKIWRQTLHFRKHNYQFKLTLINGLKCCS